MGELEGTYRVLQTPGARLGTTTPAGVSTLEPGLGPPAGAARPATRTQLRVQLLDDSVEVFDVEVRSPGLCLVFAESQVPNSTLLVDFACLSSCLKWLGNKTLGNSEPGE